MLKFTFNGRTAYRSWVITEPEYVRKYQPGASVPLYFSAVLDKVPVGFGAFNGADIRPDERKATGVGAGLYLTFRTQDQESVTAKVGLSYTSVENARLNRETEAATLRLTRQGKSLAKHGKNIWDVSG